MLNKERLYAVRGLTVSGGIDKLNDSQLNAYLKSLGSFVDSFPGIADKLQNAVDDEAPKAVISGIVSSLYDTLTKLHADSIVKEYKPKFDKLLTATQADYTALETLVENFIHRVSSLSIEVQMAAHAKSAPQQRQERPAHAKSKGNILAVDNAIMYLNTLKKLLDNQPYNLYCTTSCEEALRITKQNKPDLILLDIEMPEMNGYDLARKIKEGGCRSPIVFITANSARSYVDKAVEVGAQGLLMKPLRINQLLEKINELI